MQLQKFVLMFGLSAFPAVAQDGASGAEILAAISGNTVQGSMTASGPYAEYYAENGEIKAVDYSGNWTIAGDQMCFTYGGEQATCFGVRISGDQVTWLGNGGGDEGSGTILAGNSNNF